MRAGSTPNCHPEPPHAVRDRSKDNARRHDRMGLAIEGKPNWHANGHREVFCEHGIQATKKNFRRRVTGAAICGVDGDCPTSGHIQIPRASGAAPAEPEPLRPRHAR